MTRRPFPRPLTSADVQAICWVVVIAALIMVLAGSVALMSQLGGA